MRLDVEKHSYCRYTYVDGVSCRCADYASYRIDAGRADLILAARPIMIRKPAFSQEWEQMITKAATQGRK